MARSQLAVVAVALGLFLLPPAHAAVPPLKQPAWAELAPEQKQVLAPLSAEWDKFESFRKKKWLDIAQRYPAMNEEEQSRIQRRMKDWVKLSPEERKAAREKFKNLQKAPPEHKEAFKQKWQEYKQLPEDEKQRLNEAARSKAKPQPKTGNTVKVPIVGAVANPAPSPAAPPPVVPSQPAPAATQ